MEKKRYKKRNLVKKNKLKQEHVNKLASDDIIPNNSMIHKLIEFNHEELHSLIKKFNEDRSLVIIVDGKWKIKDMVKFLKSINYLYYYLRNEERYYLAESYEKLKCKKLIFIPNKEFIQKFGRKYYNNSEHLKHSLEIKSIKYNSPGWIELVGAGMAMFKLSELIKHYIPNKKEKIETELLEEELFEKRIDNLIKLGYSKKQIVNHLESESNRFFKNVDVVINEIEQKKITDIKCR